MTIGEFSKKYGLDIRHVNYLTDTGKLHPKNERNGRYRDYGPEAEEEIKRILIVDALGAPNKDLDKYIKMFNGVPASLWYDMVTAEIQKNKKEAIEATKKKYNDALQFVKELKKGL